MKYTLRSTKQYNRQFAGLKDPKTKVKILARLNRTENGNFGDFKHVSENLFELRFFFAGGLRIYYTIHNDKVILLLAGGDKSTQAKDIAKAHDLIDELED